MAPAPRQVCAQLTGGQLCRAGGGFNGSINGTTRTCFTISSIKPALDATLSYDPEAATAPPSFQVSRKAGLFCGRLFVVGRSMSVFLAGRPYSKTRIALQAFCFASATPAGLKPENSSQFVADRRSLVHWTSQSLVPLVPGFAGPDQSVRSSTPYRSGLSGV